MSVLLPDAFPDPAPALARDRPLGAAFQRMWQSSISSPDKLLLNAYLKHEFNFGKNRLEPAEAQHLNGRICALSAVIQENLGPSPGSLIKPASKRSSRAPAKSPPLRVRTWPPDGDAMGSRTASTRFPVSELRIQRGHLWRTRFNDFTSIKQNVFSKPLCHQLNTDR